jgi:phosphoglycolate phosphatase-like HAD superfamily hydrolase
MSIIVFDWDGTLLDSRLRHSKVLEDVLKLHGIAVGMETFGDFVAFKAEGRTTVDYLEDRLPHLVDAPTIARDWVARIELPQYLRLDELYDDTSYALGKLSRAYRLILASARQDREAFLEQVARLGVADFFDRVFCVTPGHDAGLSKARALEARGICDVFSVIGDTEADETCANEIGARFFATSRGFRSAAWWTQRGIVSFSSLSELCEAIPDACR